MPFIIIFVFAASANRLLSLQHGRCDRLKMRVAATTLQKPNNTIPQALTLILGKILDDNCEVINYLEERLQLLSAAYSEQDEHPDPKELLRLRRSWSLPNRRSIRCAASSAAPCVRTRL
ncbi:MAG: hypothetical protein ACLRXQ_06455 [Phascolarctobacterium faecium]